MKLRVTPLRFRTMKGPMRTEWYIEFFDWCVLGWSWLYHHGFIKFHHKDDALEYIRIYNSLKK